MPILKPLLGFYLRDKILALKQRSTWGFLLAGMGLIAGHVLPKLGFAFYSAIVFLSWANFRNRISRSGMFYFWLPYGVLVGFCIWRYVFPFLLGPVLGVLSAFLLGNLFFLLLTKTIIPRGKVLLLPAGFFLFEYIFHSMPGLNGVESPLLLGAIADHFIFLRLLLFTGSALGLFCILLLLSGLTVYVLERNWKSPVLSAPALVLVLALAANFLTGAQGGANTIRIAAVQGNTAQAARQLRGDEYLDYVLSAYSQLIEDVEADIFVFPEVPLAIYYPQQEKYAGTQLVDLARVKDALLITVVDEYQGSGQEQERYITALAVTPQGVAGKVSKRNLVPFSEARTITAGRDYEPVPTGLGKLGIAICYDFNAPGVISRLKANGSQVILAPFNDTGFGPVYHGIHAQYARIRALEHNLPIIVANEDGISQLIHRNGQVIARLGLGQAGVIVEEFDLVSTPGYYSVYGKTMEILAAIALAALIIAGTFRYRVNAEVEQIS